MISCDNLSTITTACMYPSTDLNDNEHKSMLIWYNVGTHFSFQLRKVFESQNRCSFSYQIASHIAAHSFALFSDKRDLSVHINANDLAGSILSSSWKQDIHFIFIMYYTISCLLWHLADKRSRLNEGTMFAFTTIGMIIPVISRTKYVLRQTWVVIIETLCHLPSELPYFCSDLSTRSKGFVNLEVAPPSTTIRAS